MSDEPLPHPLVLEYAFAEAPERLWRAISVPGLREAWLPDADVVDPEPTIVAAGQALRYRLREDEPPHRESVVTLRVVADGAGGSVLSIVHEPSASLPMRAPAANSNIPTLSRAA